MAKDDGISHFPEDPGEQAGKDVSYEYIPPPKSQITATTSPNPKILQTTARIARDLTLVCAKSGDPEPYVYGHGFTSPMVIGADDSGEYLVLDLLWSVGEIDSYAEIAGLGKTIWFDATNIGLVNSGQFEHFTGTAGQSASTIMSALKGSYDAYPNKAHSVITMQDGWNLNAMMSIYGRKIPDPRLSPVSSAFSENPALILSDVLTLCGYTVDTDSLIAAANYCDELVGTRSPQDARWEIIASIHDRHSLQHWVHTLAQYANCYVDELGGNVILTPDKPRASNHTVTQADMIDNTVRVNRAGASKTPSAVTVIYRGRGFLRPSEMTYGTSAGAGTVTQLQMPFWRRYWGAQRKAEEVYRKAQTDLTLEYTGFDDGLLRTVGDVGTITNADYGLSAQDMILEANDPVSRGRWRRKYVEYDATTYVDSTPTDPGLVDTTLYNPYNPAPGPTPTLTYDLVTTDSPNWTRIKIDFSPQTWAYLKDYKVTVTTTTDTDTILYSEYIAKGSETGSPELITTYTDFAASLGDSPQTVYRVNVYLRSIVINWDGAEVVSTVPGTATITDSAVFTTTAKHLGDGSSPSNYYQTGGGSIIGDSPLDWNGLIPAPSGSGDSYYQMTLVFCVYPVTLGDTDAWYIFGSENGNILVGNWDLTGGVWLGCRDWTNVSKSVQTTPAGSPSDYGGLIPGQWNTVMIAFDGSASPQSRNVEIWANGVEVFNGAWGTGSNANNPMSYAGYSWVGRGDGFSGVTDDGMDCYLSYVWAKEEYLDPNTYWDSFFDGDNKPLDIGTDGSSVTGSQPDTYCPDGDFTNNLGSADNWDEIGTVPAAPSSPTD